MLGLGWPDVRGPMTDPMRVGGGPDAWDGPDASRPMADAPERARG